MKLIDSFLIYLKFEKNYSDKTIESYKSDLCEFVEFHNNQNSVFDMMEVNEENIRSWVISLMECHLKETSVNRKLSCLRSFYKYLLYKGMIIKDPTQKVVGPKRKKSLPVFIKIEDMEQILLKENFEEGFVGVRDRMIIDMFYETGMRLSELIGLTDKDVDLISMKIKVTGKRDKQRYIPFGQTLKDEIISYINIRDSSVEARCDSLFLRESGEPLYRVLVYKIVKLHLSKVVSVKKKSPHVLRHTFATAMLNNDASLSAVKDLLGHEKLSTTEIYTHTTFEELRKNYKQAHPRA